MERPFYSIETDPEYIMLQTEMVRMQRWVMENNKRIVIIFEGRDTAGKGGAIMRFVRFINPRGYRIVALPKPTELEVGQWFFQRYIKELPNPGEIVFFDRSWYNRALVEPVMGFCTEEQYQVFLKQVVHLEQMLVEDGIQLFKLWFSININEQKQRLHERETDPLKQWKLSTVDMQAQQKWNDYTRYKEEMFKHTSWEKCPWIVIKGDNKDQGRMEAMRYVLNAIDYADKAATKVRLEPDSALLTIY